MIGPIDITACHAVEWSEESGALPETIWWGMTCVISKGKKSSFDCVALVYSDITGVVACVAKDNGCSISVLAGRRLSCPVEGSCASSPIDNGATCGSAPLSTVLGYVPNIVADETLTSRDYAEPCSDVHRVICVDRDLSGTSAGDPAVPDLSFEPIESGYTSVCYSDDKVGAVVSSVVTKVTTDSGEESTTDRYLPPITIEEIGSGVVVVPLRDASEPAGTDTVFAVLG